MARHDDPAQHTPDPESFTRELTKLSPEAKANGRKQLKVGVSIDIKKPKKK